MIKLFALMPRRPDLSPERFREHWRHTHAGHVKRISTVRGYVQSYPVEALAGVSTLPYDGIAEIWYEDRDAAEQTKTDPDYLDFARRDEPAFIDMQRHVLLVTRERVVLEDQAQPSSPAHSTKAIVFLTHSDDASIQTLSRLPRVTRVVEDLVLERTGSSYERVLEMWWESEDAFAADWSRGVGGWAGDRPCAGARVREVRII